MSELGLGGQRRSRTSTAAGSARSPASSTATRTRPSAATASRSSRSAQAARATRSCTRPAAGSSRPSARRARPGRTGCGRRSSATAAGCCAPARRRSRASRATASTARPSCASLRAIRAAGGVPTFLGAHSTPPEFDDADAYLDFLLADVLPDAAKLAEAADVFLERGAFDADQARRYLEACREHGLALRLHGDQFTEAGAIPLAIELGARSVDHLEATGPDGIAALAASDVTGVLLPASALFLGRPMPPGRALVDAGAAVALATDFNPGSAFCESLPLVMSLAATQLKLSPAEALAACTVNAAHVLGRADRIGRLAPGLRRRPRPARRTRLALRRLPPRRRRRRDGDQGRRRRLRTRGILIPMATKKQQRRRQKLKRHEYEEVYVDDEGNVLAARGGGGARGRLAGAQGRADAEGPPDEPRAGARSSRRRGGRRRSAACSSSR